MTLTRTLPLAALAAVLALAAQPAGAQVTTSTQDTSRAAQQQPVTNATTPPTTNDQTVTPTTTNQSNMAGQNNLNTTTNQSGVNANNGVSAGSGSMNNPPMGSTNACNNTSGMNNPDCSSGLVRPGSNMNGDMNATGRTRMRVGKDTMDNTSNGTGTTPTTPL